MVGFTMASIGKLVAAIAAVEGLDEGTVKMIARLLREEGQLSQGSYGPAAARMSARDGANLLIAVNASVVARAAPETVATYRNLKCRASRVRGGKTLESAFKAGMKLGEALETLIEAAVPDHHGGSELAWELLYFSDSLTWTSVDEWLERYRKALPDLHHIIRSEIIFDRPRPSVAISIAETGVSSASEPPPIPAMDASEREIEESQKMVASAVFLSSGTSDPRGDRSDQTKISLRTILAVGKVLAT